VLGCSLIRGPLVQIQVLEDLRLLGLLERTSTAIQVREAHCLLSILSMSVGYGLIRWCM